jgi:Cof subfamily protein (haloacid dehalogenase superfamily)/HAD superfamily hydrolase (TIGR01509 family)
MIKLLIADVDGTLVNRAKTLTPRTCEAVARLREKGIDFTITSGRPPRGMAPLVGPLKLTAPMAAFNGAMYIKPDLKTVLAQRTIAKAAAKVAIDYLLDAGLDVWIYQGSDWFIRNPQAPRVAREGANVGFAPVVISDLHAVIDSPIKIVGVSEDHPKVARAEAELSARLGADASAARSQPYYLDITHPEANKGMVVREASRLLQLPLEQIATIGDMPNDIPMLKAAGMGIAMGNAGEEVRRFARHVTRSNDEEGFAHAVDSFILGDPPLAQTGLGLPPRTRACLFALEGVLTQTANLHARAWKQLFDPHLRDRARAAAQPFIPFDLVHDYAKHFDGKPPLEDVRSFLASRGVEVPEKTVRALAEREGELYAELLKREHAETYEGSVRYVQAARAAGLRTAVVSPSRQCGDALRSAGIAELFDTQVDGVFEVDGAPDAYLAAARALGVDSEEAAVFEDEPAGLERARSDHFGYVIGVDRLGRGGELRLRGADVVVTDLSALIA